MVKAVRAVRVVKVVKFVKFVRFVIFLAIGAQFLSHVEAAVKKRSEYPFSATATFAGNVSGALYIVDSQKVKQFDRNARQRQVMEIADGERYWFSTSGFHYLVSGVEAGKLDTIGDTTLIISGIPGASNRYVFYNVLGQPLHAGRAPENARFFLSSSGRYALANTDVGAGVELRVFDSLGAQIGLCHVAACDTIIFAPNERGFMVDAGSKGLFHFFFSGEKVASYPAADCYDFSLSGKRAAMFRNGQVLLYHLDTLLATHKISRPVARKVIYQDSRGRVFILAKTHLFNINTLNGVVMMDYPTIGEGRVFEDVEYSMESDLLALAIRVSRGSMVSKGKQMVGSALRVITPDGIEQPFYYLFSNKTRKGFPQVQLKAGGKGAAFFGAEQAHNVDW